MISNTLYSSIHDRPWALPTRARKVVHVFVRGCPGQAARTLGRRRFHGHAVDRSSDVERAEPGLGGADGDHGETVAYARLVAHHDVHVGQTTVAYEPVAKPDRLVSSVGEDGPAVEPGEVLVRDIDQAPGVVEHVVEHRGFEEHALVGDNDVRVTDGEVPCECVGVERVAVEFSSHAHGKASSRGRRGDRSSDVGHPYRVAVRRSVTARWSA